LASSLWPFQLSMHLSHLSYYQSHAYQGIPSKVFPKRKLQVPMQ